MRPKSLVSRLLSALAANPLSHPPSLPEHRSCAPPAEPSLQPRILRSLLSALANEAGSGSTGSHALSTPESANEARHPDFGAWAKGSNGSTTIGAYPYLGDIVDFRSGSSPEKRRVVVVALVTSAIVAVTYIGITFISPYVNNEGPSTAPALMPFIYRGQAFDSCAAPSVSFMTRWLASPYRATFVFIGGKDRACAQPNLNSSWVKKVEALGWTVIPEYVGPQAEFGEISSADAAALGSIAADDASRQMRSLGLPPSVPIFYDMEAYPPSETSEATTFIDAWDKRLNSDGYYSGLYTACGVISDFIKAAKHITEPDVVDVGCWKGSSGLALPESYVQMWPDRYVIQITGNIMQAYGGAKLYINKDIVNISLPPKRIADVRKNS